MKSKDYSLLFISCSRFELPSAVYLSAELPSSIYTGEDFGILASVDLAMARKIPFRQQPTLDVARQCIVAARVH